MILQPGYSKTSEYGIWRGMIARCERRAHVAWPHYGGRGISVCLRWRFSFVAFLGDVGARPSVRHTLERVDNNGNYEPSNVRWATWSEQATNRRRAAYGLQNRLVTINSMTISVSDLARRAGLNIHTVFTRLQRGKSVLEAIAPTRRYSQKEKT